MAQENWKKFVYHIQKRIKANIYGMNERQIEMEGVERFNPIPLLLYRCFCSLFNLAYAYTQYVCMYGYGIPNGLSLSIWNVSKVVQLICLCAKLNRILLSRVRVSQSDVRNEIVQFNSINKSKCMHSGTWSNNNNKIKIKEMKNE